MKKYLAKMGVFSKLCFCQKSGGHRDGRRKKKSADAKIIFRKIIFLEPKGFPDCPPWISEPAPLWPHRNPPCVKNGHINVRPSVRMSVKKNDGFADF